MMNLFEKNYPILDEKSAMEYLMLFRRLQWLSAECNDEYNAGFIRNKLKDVSSTRKLISSLKCLHKNYIEDPRDV
jgi:hypothetical protein